MSRRGNSTLESFLHPTHVRGPSPLSESQASHPPSRAHFRPANLGPCARFAEEVGNEEITEASFTFRSPSVGPSAVLIGRPGVFEGILDVGSGNVSLLMLPLMSDESVSWAPGRVRERRTTWVVQRGLTQLLGVGKWPDFLPRISFCCMTCHPNNTRHRQKKVRRTSE